MNFSNKSGGNNLKTENKMKKTSQTTLSLDHERSRAVSEKIKIMNALCTRSRSIVTEEKNYYFRIRTSLRVVLNF